MTGFILANVPVTLTSHSPQPLGWGPESSMFGGHARVRETISMVLNYPHANGEPLMRCEAVPVWNGGRRKTNEMVAGLCGARSQSGRR